MQLMRAGAAGDAAAAASAAAAAAAASPARPPPPAEGAERERAAAATPPPTATLKDRLQFFSQQLKHGEITAAEFNQRIRTETSRAQGNAFSGAAEKAVTKAAQDGKEEKADKDLAVPNAAVVAIKDAASTGAAGASRRRSAGRASAAPPPLPAALQLQPTPTLAPPVMPTPPPAARQLGQSAPGLDPNARSLFSPEAASESESEAGTPAPAVPPTPSLKDRVRMRSVSDAAQVRSEQAAETRPPAPPCTHSSPPRHSAQVAARHSGHRDGCRSRRVPT
jgi:hypothetical protein